VAQHAESKLLTTIAKLPHDLLIVIGSDDILFMALFLDLLWLKVGERSLALQRMFFETMNVSATFGVAIASHNKPVARRVFVLEYEVQAIHFAVVDGASLSLDGKGVRGERMW